VADFISAIRTTLTDILGGGDNVVVAVMPDGLPPDVRLRAEDGVALLSQYQGPGYAQLYLDRLRRFIGRRELDVASFGEIARLMAVRMSYLDAIRMAQLKLFELERQDSRSRIDDVRTLRLDEIIAALPEIVADPVLTGLEWVNWSHLPVTMRFSTTSRWAVRRLKTEAWLRRFRLLSVRYGRERVWVERWLHMIDRSLTKQPAAASAVIQTATMVDGSGAAYRCGLDAWNQIIDGLAKPTFDGALQLPDLAGAIAEARLAAQRDPSGKALRDVIGEIRARVPAAAA
jgi:hypothetical protein